MKTALTSFKVIRILEPLPSLILAPNAMSSVSISDHLIFDWVGTLNIDANVLICFFFKFCPLIFDSDTISWYHCER